MTERTAVIKKTKLRLILSLVIIGFLSSASFLALNFMTKSQNLDARLINEAGRQRMLSQRTALGVATLLNKIYLKQDIDEINRTLIIDSADLLLNSHKALIDATASDEIQLLYFSGDPSLNDEILAYTAAALSISQANQINDINPSDLAYFETENVSYLLFRLNIIVIAYENDAQSKLQNSIFTGTILWLVLILALISEYNFLLKPTINLIQKGFHKQALKHKRMQLAADSTELGIWEYHIQNQQLYWDNKMWQIFYETDPQESPTSIETFKQRLHKDDINRVMNAFSHAISHYENMNFVFRIITPNKTIKYIQVNSIVEYDNDHQAISIVGTNQDISDQIHKEDALIIAKEKAEAATHIKGDFLASMSHEIRTPLNGVMGMLSLLKNTPLNALQNKRVNIAYSSARSLLVLINDILDFSKIEADKLQIESIEFDLNKMLSEIIESLAQLAQEKHIELILDTIKLKESRVMGDPNRIRQVLINLIANAIKFTHEGHVILSTSLKSMSDDTWQMDFSIEDTGIGIAEEKQAHLFDAFSQVDASTTRKYGGTGLGLAIVKRLCTAMGGTINVSSQVDRGSRFYGHFLLGKSQHSNIIAPNVDVSQMNILVVDDNTVNLTILQDQLQSWGIHVTSANSGQEALKICEKRIQNKQPIFDIGILDMQMPDMDGAELGKLIKQDKHFKNMHLVMMTSMISDKDNQIMAGLGFSAYFTKPVTTEDIFLALNVIAEHGEAYDHATPLITHDYLSSLEVPPETAHNDLKSKIEQLPNKHILVVEDNAINQMVVTDLLEDLGFSITCSENGIEALSDLNKTDTPFCLIFMDCQMPKMDGYTTTKEIRNGNAGPLHLDTPIVALTANTMKGDQQKCLESGMNDFIAKPLEQSELERVIQSWVLFNK